MKYVITIGRQYGSGGRYIGQELAKRLGISFYDQSLLDKVSEESGLDINYLKDRDEQKESIFAYLGIRDGSGFVSSNERVAFAQFDTIRSIAYQESCVIVGRCADYVLRNNPNVINVFIHAPREDRIKRIVEFYNVPENKAEAVMHKMDKKRAGYYSFYTDKKWGHASNYDLTISSSIGIEACVEVIAKLVEQRLNK